MPIKSPEVIVPDLLSWRQWLASNHSKSTAIWLVVARQEGIIPKIIYKDALDEALCYGWIDSGGGPRDAQTRYVRFGPRKSNSAWSRRNIGFVERLLKEGRMAEPGKAAIARAKSDGFWDAAYSADHVPEDLAAGIANVSGAAVAWERMPKKDRYAILVRLGGLPISSEARSKKINSVVERLASQRVLVTPENTRMLITSKDIGSEVIAQRQGLRSTRSSKRIAEAQSKEH